MVADVTAVGLGDTTHATVFDNQGRPQSWALQPGPTTDPAEPTESSVSRPSSPPTPTAPGREAGPALSTREQGVLRLVADGLSNQDIADRLFISVNTVRSHRRSLMTKFEAHSSIDLVNAGRSHGLLD